MTSSIITTSQFNETAKNILQMEEITASPLMFEDETICDTVESQLDVSHTINRVISTAKSQLPSQWTLNFKTPSIEGTGCMISRSNDMDPIYLTKSSIERVNICGLCDYAPDLNESNDLHNRTITDITDNAPTEGDSFVRSVLGSFAKRAKLNQPPVVTSDLGLAESSDILGKLAESTAAINDQLVSLHEDCGKHLTMVHHIIGAVDV